MKWHKELLWVKSKFRLQRLWLSGELPETLRRVKAHGAALTAFRSFLLSREEAARVILAGRCTKNLQLPASKAGSERGPSRC